jgi:protease I
MVNNTLAGKKIAILVETEFIPEEIEAYQKRFAELGATVHLMSRLWGQESVRFVSDVDTVGKSLQYLDVSIDFQNVDINDYAAVIMAAGYTSVRLRYFQPPKGYPISPEQTRIAPAVHFLAEIMENPQIIKGFLCHGLWLLTPMPELLKGRRVICHEVVLADIINAGAIYVPSPTNIVVDGDLVTGKSGHDVYAFIDAITHQIAIVEKGLPLLSYEQAARQAEAERLSYYPHEMVLDTVKPLRSEVQ